MPIELLMPALSPTMTEGNLAKWHKKEGDAVKAGDVIAEIETDKATMEVEAVDEGTLGKILVPEGARGVEGQSADRAPARRGRGQIRARQRAEIADGEAGGSARSESGREAGCSSTSNSPAPRRSRRLTLSSSAGGGGCQS